jgi:UDP-N-acetylglucosamine enolpyruvyl transferase
MDKFIIQGGKKLSGSIAVNGAKNSALKILAALSCRQKMLIKNSHF